MRVTLPVYIASTSLAAILALAAQGLDRPVNAQDVPTADTDTLPGVEIVTETPAENAAETTTETAAEAAAEPPTSGAERPAVTAAGDDDAVAPDPATADLEAETPPMASVLALTVADSLLEEPYRVGEERRTVEVASGDTILALMLGSGAASRDAHALIDALETVYNPRDLQIGQEITLVFNHHGYSSSLEGLELMPSVETIAMVRRNADGDFEASEVANDLDTRRVAAAGTITNNLAADTGAAGVPYGVLVPLIRAYSYTVDFQRDIQPGDSFEILFERDFFADGTQARNGDVLYARLRLGDRDLPVYQFETDDGMVDYYDRDGLSVRRALLRTPIDGARLSSGFGMRRHPILGYTRMHRGVDFAAPTGTPILAAGDGVVDLIGPNRGYGNYIRLRHNSRMATAYAHMSRFARGLSRGTRVRQGDVIGFVGSTGLSTGPHLHYEVLIGGSQVNPLSVDLPTGRELAGTELARFRGVIDALDAAFAESLRERDQLAETPEP